MKNKMLALKVYDVDYSFIIKNYLDEKLWEKEWTIFVYKRFKVMLRLDSINVKTKGIWFEVIIDDNSEDNKNFQKRFTESFLYHLSVENIDILKKQLNSTIFKVIKRLELESYIQHTDKYEELSDMKYEEYQKLEEIANEFLDSESVTNNEIREAYIDYYIDKNEKVYELKNQYIEEMKYKIITDFYVAFLQATNDEDRLEIIRQRIGQSELEETIKIIEEYKEYMETEDYEEEMKNNLDEV